MKAILVDDEPLARKRMQSLLEHIEGAPELVGEFGSARLALEFINKEMPDVVFLDIQMPGLDGFDVISLLQEPRPYIIFVTAYDEYAIKAFEVHALDYLTKPVRIERLKKSIERLNEINLLKKEQKVALDEVLKERESKPLQVLTAKKGRNIHVLDINEVYSIEAEDKLIYAFSEDKKYRIDLTLDKLEARLPDNRFIRAHRSALVNVKYVKELIPWFSGTYELKLVNEKTIKISRRRVKEVKSALGLI